MIYGRTLSRVVIRSRDGGRFRLAEVGSLDQAADDQLPRPDAEHADRQPAGRNPSSARPSTRRPSISMCPQGRSGVSARPSWLDQVVEMMIGVRDLDLLRRRAAGGRTSGPAAIATRARRPPIAVSGKATRSTSMKVAPMTSDWLKAYQRQSTKQATEQIPISPPEGMNTSTIRSRSPGRGRATARTERSSNPSSPHLVKGCHAGGRAGSRCWTEVRSHSPRLHIA